MLCRDAFDFFLRELPKLPGNYLEFGVFDGETISRLAAAFPEKQFYGVDPFIEDGNTYHISGVGRGDPMPCQRQSSMDRVRGMKNVQIFIEASRDFARRFDPPNEPGLLAMKLSAVLVDGSHHYEDASSDFMLAGRALEGGGVIFFDDTYLEGVSRSVREFRAEFEPRISEATVVNSSCSFIRLNPK